MSTSFLIFQYPLADISEPIRTQVFCRSNPHTLVTQGFCWLILPHIDFVDQFYRTNGFVGRNDHTRLLWINFIAHFCTRLLLSAFSAQIIC